MAAGRAMNVNTQQAHATTEQQSRVVPMYFDLI